MTKNRASWGAMRAPRKPPIFAPAAHGVQSVKLNGVRAAGAWKSYPEYFLSREALCNAYLDYIPNYFADNAPTDLVLDGFFEYTKGAQSYRMGFVRDCAAEALGGCV